MKKFYILLFAALLFGTYATAATISSVPLVPRALRSTDLVPMGFPGNATAYTLSVSQIMDYVQTNYLNAADMSTTTYDPTGVGADVYARANHTGTQPATTITGLATVATTGLLSDLTTDATHRVVTDTQVTTWGAKQSALTVGVDYLAPSGSAAGLTSFPTLNQNTTGTAANLSGAPALPNGTTATTQAPGDSTTKIATDAFVANAVASIGMTYPGAGVAVSTGSAWGTSLSITGISDSVGITSSTTTASSTAVKAANDLAAAAVPLSNLPSASVDGEVALFSGTGGKTVKRSTLTGIVKQTSGVASVAAAGTDYSVPAGTENLSNKTLIAPAITGYIETTATPTVTAGAVTISLANGTKQKVVTAANTTITLPSAVAGASYTIYVSYGGAHSITWAGGTSIRPAGGTAPVATSVSGKYDIYVFDCVDTSSTQMSDGGRNF